MSAQSIVCQFLPIFYDFSSKLPEIAKFLFKIVIFIILDTPLRFWFKILSREGATFNFRPILADFREYTLNMTTYHVTDAINGYF